VNVPPCCLMRLWMNTRTLLILAVFLCAPALLVQAADWPQWRGPDRTDISKETGLLKTWPKGGPKLLWTYRDAGGGYSGPAIVGARLYLQGAVDGKDCLFALDVQNGTRLWSTPISTKFTNGYGDGPRGTPTVDGDRVYALSGQGDLICVEATNGK